MVLSCSHSKVAITLAFSSVVMSRFFKALHKMYAYSDTKMKQEAITKGTSALNPIKTAQFSVNWQEDEEIIKRLYMD